MFLLSFCSGSLKNENGLKEMKMPMSKKLWWENKNYLIAFYKSKNDIKGTVYIVNMSMFKGLCTYKNNKPINFNGAINIKSNKS